MAFVTVVKRRQFRRVRIEARDGVGSLEGTSVVEPDHSASVSSCSTLGGERGEHMMKRGAPLL